MKKIFFLSLFVLLLFATTGCSNQTNQTSDQSTTKSPSTQTANANQSKSSSDYPMSSAENVANKVQVFLFHATQRCTTCTAIGRLAGETVNERFQDELKSGRIEFREINIDLPENEELARKFGASGSTLRLNAIKGGEDNITEDTRVWRLTSDPVAFKDYLEGVLNTMLGK